jgi:polysaccharide export outer membrane protein
MNKFSMNSVLFSLCLQGLVLAPAFAQGASTSSTDANTAANLPVDARVNSAVTSAVSTATGDTTDAANYILGPEDQITVRVFAADDIPDRPAQIANDGTVSLPMVGIVHAAGLTVDQLQTNLVAAYRKYFKDPQVTVQVTDSRSQPVSVAGNVNTPGVVQLKGTRNLMEVIGMAGGLKADAGDSVLLTRLISEGAIPVSGAFTDPSGKYSVAHINIRSVMSGADPQSNILIKAHDVITVPRARMIYVLGNVGRPGGYVMTDNETMSVSKALALAGGWDKTAALGSARILRASGGGSEREQIPADLRKIMNNKIQDVQLRPDDILFVPNSLAKALSIRGAEAAVGLGTGLAIYK